MSKLENPRMEDENYQQKKYTMRKVTRQIYGLRNCSKKQNNQYEMMEYMATPSVEVSMVKTAPLSVFGGSL